MALALFDYVYTCSKQFHKEPVYYTKSIWEPKTSVTHIKESKGYILRGISIWVYKPVKYWGRFPLIPGIDASAQNFIQLID